MKIALPDIIVHQEDLDQDFFLYHEYYNDKCNILPEALFSIKLLQVIFSSLLYYITQFLYIQVKDYKVFKNLSQQKDILLDERTNVARAMADIVRGKVSNSGAKKS